MKKNLIYSDKVSLEDAIKMLDENGNGFLAVVDDENHLLGILTDGDIRRAFLNKLHSLDQVMNKNPVKMSVENSKNQVIKHLHQIHRKQMPIVDNNNVLVDVIILDEFEVNYRPNFVVIMAGGLGSRLGNLTKEMPKPMLPFNGQPLLKGLIDQFKSQGFQNFILCVNYKSHIIEDYFKDGSQFGVNISYTHEDMRMGTAGALSLIDKSIIKDPFFVLNGDLITTLDYSEFLKFHLNKNADASMCIKNFRQEIPYARVLFNEDDSLTSLDEKPIVELHINAGMYILNPMIMDLVPKNKFFDMPELFELLIQNKNNTSVFKMDDYWLDIGRPTDYSSIMNLQK